MNAQVEIGCIQQPVNLPLFPIRLELLEETQLLYTKVGFLLSWTALEIVAKANSPHLVFQNPLENHQ
ncbi:asr1150 [Nostoc sp. PCC 7120 = FACHB-418]|nr:asr1150 [Nostoc sp. PCC 7120 = FACHB-418]